MYHQVVFVMLSHWTSIDFLGECLQNSAKEKINRRQQLWQTFTAKRLAQIRSVFI
jgi:hypothetical protein